MIAAPGQASRDCPLPTIPTVITVTPAIAQGWLNRRNGDNRRLSTYIVNRYVQSMLLTRDRKTLNSAANRVDAYRLIVKAWNTWALGRLMVRLTQRGIDETQAVV
jgi:hypothetical protein